MSYTTTFQYNVLTLAVLSTLGIAQQAQAETTEKIVTAPVVVTATRAEQNSFDLPVAIDVVESKDVQNGQLQMTLSESLIRVPGITAQSRTQSAQDPQISSRGFGSRSSFGVRGIRVYVDGIPLTMPDGQGQPGVVDLSAIKSIEVMRGPFSALYGNSSGGVIQMLTKDAPKTPEVGATVMFGSYDTKRNVLEASGQLEGLEYMLNISNFESEGYRANSASNKQMATAKFKFNLDEDTKVTALVNWFDQEAQDPLGLDRARSFSSSTRNDVVPAALFANTSVKRDHTQVGFNIEHAFNANNKITLTPYVGTRKNAQILTTTALATTLTGPGGTSTNFCNTTRGTCARVSEIDREFYGTDARWDNSGYISNLPYKVSLGVTYGKSSDDRLDTNILNNGFKVNTLNRNEVNEVSNFDQYIQSNLSLSPTFDVHAGARHTKVKLNVKDNLVSLNGNNSGSVDYQKTTPVIGAVWKASEALNFYANFGKGFETPTFIEAAFDNVTTGVASKPNLSLKAAESRNIELGAKAFITDNIRANLTLFKIDTDNEIVTRQTVSGRSSYQNAGQTKRTGIEASIDASFDNNITAFASYTLLNAKFEDPFVTVINAGGTTGTVHSGNHIPGTYKSQVYGEIAWKYPTLGFFSALEGRHNSEVYVNDINSDKAPSYTIFNIRAGFEQSFANWGFREYLRIENITDKDYIGSVRVNDGNALYFEPAAGRNYLLGLSARYKF
ncbi:TonB-dependent receptor family protein [Methylotenera mobilis]|uniref:TonB-dependent receptor n=1 Tax=Methylotenera mobilis (strain JLW8 / ATCC BAA-1282 / DSM 17540) TaxID=583345 RepID=C6WTG7_METML|nr:TonB-dependent receptor [Methylotenera mobilis]ACT47289.1 TonB-dependent receptor [Methylotenera mobilis JLW8]